MAAKTKTAEDPRGLKRICMNCGTRFYDMNKRPIICPSCETEFTGEIKVKTRRSRTAVATEAAEESKAAAAEEAANDEGEIEAETDDVEVVSLDDAAEGDDGADDAPDDVADADLDLDALEDDAEGDDLEGLEGDVNIADAPTKDE